MRHFRAPFIAITAAGILGILVETMQSPPGSAATRADTQVADIHPEAFHTTYRLQAETGDGRDLVVLSGYAEIDGNDLRGNPDGTWSRKDLVFRVGPYWKTVETVPVVSMTSIMNVGAANNAGWAVDECSVIDTWIQSRQRRFESLKCRVGVRDSDGYMFRVNYYVTMVGVLA